MEDQSPERLAAALKRVLETIELADVLTAPFNESIEHLLLASCRGINADGASVLLPYGDEGDLEFKWACGAVSDSLVGARIPAGKGIAGFVFSTGQPMAVSDTEQEASFYSKIDRTTGFSTHTILATPLQFGGEITGVLEYVNREGTPPFEPFSPEEMDLAALYAEAVSSLVHAHNSAEFTGRFGSRVIENALQDSDADSGELLNAIGDSGNQSDAIRLAELVRSVSSLGERERKLCMEILESFKKLTGSGERKA
ncbi:MAG: GAF domain-containing protein [Acidobacteria bacterium]|nr:MAG: GAF domain-containing protein [Acidobacteriota bacterium]REK01565.1 MAG: GAF domain-containing protein [Acidobacteriota bacterium]REK14521.1 MAG: GAF domain-containing protein [Acidobacteriota bacterium]REK45236.1 MAG: GAF domain-containing protein [Acidobacteriota bacterium]